MNCVHDGSHCVGCGLPNYRGLCPVCRADEQAYERELVPFFGPWDATSHVTSDEDER